MHLARYPDTRPWRSCAVGVAASRPNEGVVADALGVVCKNALSGAEMTSRTRLMRVDMTVTNLVLAEHTQKMICAGVLNSSLILDVRC